MLRDLRIAIRTLRSWRLGAAGALITLAVGIGSTTTMYAVLRVALAGTAPAIDDVERVGRIYAASAALGVDRAQVTLNDFQTAVATLHTFQAAAAYAGTEMTLGAQADAPILSVLRISPSFFEVLPTAPAEGRIFTADDFSGDSRVVLMSDAAWRRHFAGRSLSGVVTVMLDGTEHRVVGVLPPAFDFPFIGLGGDAWVPLALDERSSHLPVSVIARLNAAGGWQQVAGDLSRLPRPQDRDASYRWRAIPLEQDTRVRTVGALAGTVVPALVVLVIGCLNVSCMLLARGIDRERELNVRAALGASRAAIIRQLVAENLLLAAGGGLAGAALATWALDVVAAVIVPVRPHLAAQLADGQQLLLPIAMGASVLASVLFGTLPALRLSRRDIASALKGFAPPARARIVGYGARDLVVFVEVGLAVVLVTVTAMWFSFFTVLNQVTANFPATEIVTARLAARDAAAAIQRVEKIPDVQRTTIATQLPGRQGTSMLRADNGRLARGAFVGVAESFFDTLGLPLIRGRSFDRTEVGGAAAVVVVSEAAASALWPGEDPLGRELGVDEGARTTRLIVVGVSRNPVEFGGLGILTAGDVYYPIDPAGPAEVSLLARTRNAPAARRPIAAALRPSSGDAMPRPAVLGDLIAYMPTQSMPVVHMFGVFALVAVFLAGSGIFAVVSQSVALRTTELGVRMALGATTGRMLRMVLVREVKLIVAAIACGAIGTVAVSRIVFAELVTIAAFNPFWPAALMAGCGGVAAIACALATYRIVRLDPWSVLQRN